MKRRTQRAVILAYLAMISIIAPVAFLIGNANGSNKAALVSQNDTNSGAKPLSPYSLVSTIDDCVLLGYPGTIRRTGVEIDCMLLKDSQPRASTGRKVAVNRAPNRKRTALDNAFAIAIAVDAAASGRAGVKAGPGATPNPISLALAIETQGGSRLGSPTTPFGGGRPNIFTPLIGMGDIGPLLLPSRPPIDDIPDLVTPVPAALPLLLTGFAGLFAATRRKRRNSDLS